MFRGNSRDFSGEINEHICEGNAEVSFVWTFLGSFGSILAWITESDNTTNSVDSWKHFHENFQTEFLEQLLKLPNSSWISGIFCKERTGRNNERNFWIDPCCSEEVPGKIFEGFSKRIP